MNEGVYGVARGELDREQEYVDLLYARIDDLREQAAKRLAEALSSGGGTRQAMLEREATVGRYTDQVARLEAAENGLCFGRLDLIGAERHYIGRIGIADDSEDGDPLLLDWRAPAARPFYTATAASPEGVRRRRHIALRHRRVTGLDDELLDQNTPGTEEGLVGEAVLFAALSAGRSGRMRDIVETLQAEQDAIIRSAAGGVLVVQGGPGTGKTAVALHRAAYLLYTHRNLAARGVLVVGPNATFLSYIGQVLPGLGETNVLLATLGELFPGITADLEEPEETAELKGRAVMADVLAAAVADHEAAVSTPIEVQAAGETLRLEPSDCAQAAARARDSRLPHNQARRVFAAEIVAVLAEQLATRTQDLVDRLEQDLAEVLTEAELAALHTPPDVDFEITDEEPAPDPATLRRELAADQAVQDLIDRLWPTLSPQGLLAYLYADPQRLALLAEDERRRLHRAGSGHWSAADIPLLDEAAELLGEDDRPARALAARRRAESSAYAQGVLDIVVDPEMEEQLTAADVIDAERLAGRHEAPDHRTIAERAAADRTWAFGHMIVDEAQELSPMAWRMLMRRCPSRSMTVVGDVAQTGTPGGASSWHQMLSPHVADRWRLAELTVNYRTPAEIMTLASAVLTAIDPAATPPRSVRRTGQPPLRIATTPADLPAALAEQATAEAAALNQDGRVAVIVPDDRLADLATAIPHASYGPTPDLESPIVVLTVRQAKGLEFDSVLIADPAALAAATPHGLNDLYVALTRTTTRLSLIHPHHELPDILR